MEQNNRPSRRTKRVQYGQNDDSNSRRKYHNQQEYQQQPQLHDEVHFASRNPFATIRAVTPESIPEGIPVDQMITSSPTSPQSSLRDSPTSLARSSFRVRSGSEIEDRNVSQVMRDALTRPRTRTLEDLPREIGPSNLYMKNWNRIGSVHSSNPANFRGVEETVTSIGHPSTVPGPLHPSNRPAESSRSKLVKQPPQTASPKPPNSPSLQDGNPNNPIQTTNARQILHLMRSSCGRMEGMLAFRRNDTSPWSLSYCSINDEAGSLVYEPKSGGSYYKTLISDLRGCQIKTSFDSESQMPYLDVCQHNSSLQVHLRPHTQDEFDSWFAALLCWQPIRPKGIQNKMTKPQVSLVGERRLADSRRHSEVSLLKEAPIIKVGKMIFWDTNVSYSHSSTPLRGSRPPNMRMQSFGSRRWRKVSCTLRENGELKLYSDSDVTLVSVLQLSQLSRCAVQRLDPSVLDNEFCIAIYPQYTTNTSTASYLRPIFLSLESRVLYEVWLVLLRAFTIPELYGPKEAFTAENASSSGSTSSPYLGSMSDLFRMERSLSFRIVEARLIPPVSPKMDSKHSPLDSHTDSFGGYYAEILLDGETRGRTMAKTDQLNPFWREEFEFADLPAVLSVASIVLKKRPPSKAQNERSMRDEARKMYSALSSSDEWGNQSSLSFDSTCGRVDIYLDDLDAGKEVEKWWPLMNSYGQNVGEVYLKVLAEEDAILMARDYQPMSELLHRFSNGLTLQLAQMVSGELKRLSECLLNIFQVSGQASDWILSLVEEEIDGTIKETPASRMRLSRRLGSTDSDASYNSHNERELLVRDLGKSASLEANLLFRGNTLLTKSLDFHMKRLGKEYLEDTLGDKLKDIADSEAECEVDPNKITNQHELERNWRRLIGLTEDCWKCIAQSAARCPPELRFIFRHVRACAEDRYGDFLRTVSYSSVSGFLFLRFFCPAILNPKLFGLLKDHPKPQARRTLTLIAKSLQGLANLTTFGAKETWMEPMNAFLTAHRQEFKNFIDSVCSIPTTSLPITTIPPSYSTPLAILQRLPPTSREGFPSLPYLIDHARNFAALVALWLEHSAQHAAQIRATDGDLLKFHNLCQQLDQRTKDCLDRAERAERPSSNQSFKWEELIEQMESSHVDAATPSSTTFSAESSSQNAHEKAGVHGGTPIALKGRIANAQLDPLSANTSQYASSVADEDTPPGSAGAQPSESLPFSQTPTTEAARERERERDREREREREKDRERAYGADDSVYSGFASGSNVSSDAEGTTALPRIRREDRLAQRDEREGKSYFGGFVPGFKKRK